MSPGQPDGPLTDPAGVPVDARQRHAELAGEVEDLAYRYYVLAQPTASDAE